MSLVTQLFKRRERHVHSLGCILLAGFAARHGRGEVPICWVVYDGGRLRRVDGEAVQGTRFAGDTRSGAGTDGATS